MTKSEYDWENGTVLKSHTERKLKILRAYFSQYLRVRCRLPQQERFKLCIVDGFSGGGRYEKGEEGSPLIFLNTLKVVSNEINVRRATQNMGPIRFDCLLVLNDASQNVINLLRRTMAPLLVEAEDSSPHLCVKVQYENELFEALYPQIRQQLVDKKFKNVIFNLDQYGTANVKVETLCDILRTFHSSGEIFLTFSIQSMLTFLPYNDSATLRSRLSHLNIAPSDLASLDGPISKNERLGAFENLAFLIFQSCARFVSCFAINNPNGWEYWLIHFSNFYRARQVYNDVLHDNANYQAHYGRSGLNFKMLAYNPAEEGTLYLFSKGDRENAIMELNEDIPHLVEKCGDVINIEEFYNRAYNMTPAHSEDINSTIVSHSDIDVLTPSGNPRRKAHTIKLNDTLKLKRQKSFHFFTKIYIRS